MLQRRQLLTAFGGLCGYSLATHSVSAETVASRQRVLRVAHVTDVHLQPELQGAEGLAACFHHLQSQTDAPGLILLGGDHIMKSFDQPRDRVQTQWDLWQSVTKAELSTPMRSCLGNQDVYGWNKAASKTSGCEPEYGKKWALDVLGLPKSYYSFSQAGWHFIALDGLQPGDGDGSLAAYYDEEQFAWLERELASVPNETPILIWTHVPIVSVLPILMAKRDTTDSHALVAAGNVHTDANRVVALLQKYPNVKACFSGHLHRVEHVQFRGIDFYSTGAVCGAWWKGPIDGFSEGYTVIDLFDDGSHQAQYVPYGWKAVAS